MNSTSKINVPIGHTSLSQAGKYGLKPADFPNACATSDSSISLPLLHGMTQAEQIFAIGQEQASKL